MPSTGLSPDLVVSGTLIAHGTTAPVTLTIPAVQAVPDGLRCRATTRLDRHAFGVTAGRGIIGRYLHIELDIVSTVDRRPEPRPTLEAP